MISKFKINLPSYNWLIVALILTTFLQPSKSNELIIEGDNKTLINAESIYHIRIVGDSFPFSPLYKYVINMDGSKGNLVHYEIFIKSREITWKVNFTKMDLGSFPLHVEAYCYPFENTIYGWKIADLIYPIQIQDTLDDFINIDINQNISSISTENVFMVNKTVNFTALIQSNTILSHNTKDIKYHWILEGPNINHTELTTSSFEHVFNVTGEYTVTLEITAIIQPNDMLKKGKISKTIQMKDAISNITITGNTFVENGSLLSLNILCNGTSKFLICHDFSLQKSNDSCFNKGRVFNNCDYSITHYFSQNGTRYVNIGVRNDVSTVFKNVKITIYKIGPKPSFAFVVIPLISLMLVLAITVFGITHCIRQRRRLNATIEVASTQNFGVYADDETLLEEKTFTKRVNDSFREFFQRKQMIT